MASTTVRISREARDLLRDLMNRTNRPAGDILHQAIEEFRRKCFLEDANRAFAALRRDRKAWQAELEDRKAWESTLADGADGR